MMADTIAQPCAHTSERRARQIGERVRDYWAARGYRIYVHYERIVDRNRIMFVVRSDLVGGLPRDWRGAGAASESR